MSIQKYDMPLVNTILFLLILFFIILSCHNLIKKTPHLQNDYSTFYYSLKNKNTVYNNTITSFKRDQSNVTDTTGIIDATNYNTPTMNLILSDLIHPDRSMMFNAILWTLFGFLGASISAICAGIYLFGNYRYVGFCLFLLLFSWPSFNNQVLGQVSYIVLPLLSIAFLLGHYKHLVAMTITLALLASIKLFFLLFLLLFLMNKQWKLTALFLFSFLVFFTLPIVYFSLETYQHFFQIAMQPSGIFARSTRLENGSLLGVLTKIIITQAVPGKVLPMMPVQAVFILIASYIVIRFILYYNTTIKKCAEYRYEFAFSFIVALSLLLSPLAWTYYHVFFLIPVIVFLKVLQRYQPSWLFYPCFLFALLLPYAVGIPVFLLSQFCVFLDVLFWIFCIVLLVEAVKDEKLKVKKGFQWACWILTSNSILCIILILCDYGQTGFLKPFMH